MSYSEIRLVPKKRTEQLAEDAEGRQRESGTGSDKEKRQRLREVPARLSGMVERFQRSET